MRVIESRNHMSVNGLCLCAQSLVEPGVIEQDVFHAALNSRRIQRLRVHQRVRVYHHDR